MGVSSKSYYLIMAAADGMCSLLNLSTALDTLFSITLANRMFCSMDVILIAQLYLFMLFTPHGA